jgi:hypothetical protein
MRSGVRVGAIAAGSASTTVKYLPADRDPLIDPADLHRFGALDAVRRDNSARLGDDLGGVVAVARFGRLRIYGGLVIDGSAAPSVIPVRPEVMKSRRSTRYSRRHRYDRIERAATGLVLQGLSHPQSAIADRSDAVVVGEGLFGLHGGVQDSPDTRGSSILLVPISRGSVLRRLVHRTGCTALA